MRSIVESSKRNADSMNYAAGIPILIAAAHTPIVGVAVLAALAREAPTAEPAGIGAQPASFALIALDCGQ